ncbi:hypothetical protein GOZ89_23755 [Agrobacterium vitis]|uniref:hypothetical protein n=1 Tax=Agrobacterium vitis TaxID=373 RepID=UPI0012E95D72|nr:hypothetical protein [Agrobacterium vitis]MVA82431.1 hypothetical protein [Agrobacterium vitis]
MTACVSAMKNAAGEISSPTDIATAPASAWATAANAPEASSIPSVSLLCLSEIDTPANLARSLDADWAAALAFAISRQESVSPINEQIVDDRKSHLNRHTKFALLAHKAIYARASRRQGCI